MRGLVRTVLIAVPAVGLCIGATKAATYDLASEFSST